MTRDKANVCQYINKEIIYDMIKDIKDPERDLTLEQLDIVQEDSIEVYDNEIQIQWTPTVPTCSFALNIGLSIRLKLLRENVESKKKVNIIVKKGMHIQENEINKQLNDKERYRAALENPDIVHVLQSYI